MKSAPHKSTTFTLDLESSPVFFFAFFNKPKQKNGYKIDFATSGVFQPSCPINVF